MPRNKFQTIIFTLLMTFFMVYVIICYNIAIETGSMRNEVFFMAFGEMKIMWPVGFILEMVIAERLAMRMTQRILTPQMKSPILMMLVISTMTVCVMCPLMSLAAVILFKHSGTEMIAVWLSKVIFNFPMAFFSQIFFVGPLVRLIFGTIFKQNREEVPA